jgi:hypothetical protein
MKTGSEERAIAIEKINKQYGTSLKNLTDEELFLKQVNEQVKDYTKLAKDRLKIKINEAKAETFLQQASEKRYENEKKRADLSNVMMKYKAAQNAGDERSIAITKKVIDNLNEEIAANERIALGYQAKADKVLDVNAKMLSNETAQEKKEREDRDKEAQDALNKQNADKLKASRKAAADIAKAQKDEEQKKLEAILQYNEAHAKSVKSIEDYIQSTNDETTKKYLSNWKSAFLEKIEAVDDNLKSETKKYMDEYGKLFTDVKAEFEKSPAYITFKTKMEGASAEKVAEEYNKAFQAYIDVTPGLKKGLQKAQNAMNTAIQTATTNAAQESSRIWKEEFDKVKEQVKDTTRIALATDEYERFYEFVKIKNSKLLVDIQIQAANTRKIRKDEIKAIEEQIAATEIEIEQRTKLNEKAGEGATIENLKRQLNATSDPAERKAIQDTIDDTEKKNKTDRENIEIKKAQIAEIKKQIKATDDLMKANNMGYLSEAGKNTKVMIKPKRTGPKPTFMEEIANFADILEQQLPGAKQQVDLFGKQLDILSGQADASSSKIAKITAKKAISDLFDLNREYNSKSLGDATKTNIQLAAIYKDKSSIIKEQEKDINDNMSTLFNEAQENATKNNNQNVLNLMQTLKKADGTFKEFAITVTDEANQFGLDVFGTIFGDRLELLNNALTKRYEMITEAEETAYNDALFRQYKLYETGVITQEEYNKNIETIDKNHKENMLANDVSYGKKAQAELLDFYKTRKANEQAEFEKEKARKIANAEALMAIERELQQWYFDYYNQQIDKRSANVEIQLQQELEAIDLRKSAYEQASSELTAREKADKMELDGFDKERKNVEDKARAEQQALDKKRFDADKANKAISIGLEYALAIAKAWGTLGPFGAPMAVFLGAQALVAEAAVLSAEYIPAFADGGLVTGPGGPKDDKIDAKLSNGESVINAKSTKMFAPLLSAMNVAGGGRAFPMASGGMVTPQMVQQSGNYDMSRLENILEKYSERPIETYVKESSVTSAQMRTDKIKRRTSF